MKSADLFDNSMWKKKWSVRKCSNMSMENSGEAKFHQNRSSCKKESYTHTQLIIRPSDKPTRQKTILARMKLLALQLAVKNEKMDNAIIILLQYIFNNNNTKRTYKNKHLP